MSPMSETKSNNELTMIWTGTCVTRTKGKGITN